MAFSRNNINAHCGVKRPWETKATSNTVVFVQEFTFVGVLHFCRADKMHFIRFYILLIAVIISVHARRNRKVAPRGCSFDGKKKQDKACNPFWKIKQPNCHASNAHRIKRTECSKKFCWKIVDNKTRKGNNNIPSEGKLVRAKTLSLSESFSDSFLVIQAKQAKSNQQAVAQFESQPFRIIPKKNTKCFSFRHLMRAKVSDERVIYSKVTFHFNRRRQIVVRLVTQWLYGSS